ncbi:MAG: T9SS type A sorting domain-containing protein [Sphingobacteriales bacterium]|nr:MAG: T9SS type A sorting domain-containing protein [Sphingobacteriales bacterium]
MEKMTNRCATSIGDPLPYQWGARNSSTDKTVWASFVAPSTGKVKIRAENIDQIRGEDDYHQDINLQLAVFQTSNCFDKWRLTELRSGFGFDGGCIELDPTNADDYTGVCLPGVLGCGFDEYMVVSCLKPGETYYIMIDGDASYVAGADFEDVEGDFRISVQEVSGIPASTNDDICDAATIAGVNALAVNGSVTTVAFNNSCATIEPNIEGAGKIAEKITGTYQDNLADLTTDEFNVEHSLWFKFQAPASGKVRIEALQEVNDIDLGIAVYDIPNQTCNGLATNGFTIMEDYDPPILGGQSEDMEVHCLVPNRWYWVQVDGDRNTTCGPLLTAICGDPLRDVAGGTGTDCETGQFKVKITHLPADPTYASNVDYTVNPDLPGGNDNMCEAHRVKNPSGSINIFNNATYLQNGESITFRHNNRCATTEVNEPEMNGWDLNPFNSDNTPTVWYAFNTGPILPPLLPGEITINVTNPSGTCFDPDMDLYEYTGALNSYYTAAGCTNLGNNKFNRLYRVGEGTNIPYLPLNPRNERITLTCPKPMTTYLLRVAGSSACPLFGDNMGDFDISISMSATPGLDVANDDICNARNMGTVAAGGSQIRNLENNFCATQQQGEPNTDQDCVQSEPCSDETVWFKFRTSATPGDIEVVVRDVLSNGYIAAPQIAVYRYIGADNSCTTDPFNGIAKLDENTGVVVLAGVTVDSAKVSIPCAKPNTWYYVQVDGIDMSLLGFTLPGATDNFLFNLQVRDLGNYSKRASNDNLVNALPMDSTVTAPGLYVLPAGGTKSRYGHNICATCENNESGDYCGTSETGHTAIFSAEDETVWFYFTTSDNPGVTTITVADNPSISGTFSPNFTLYYYNQTMGNPAFRVTNAPSRVIIQEGSSSTGVSSTSESFTCLLPNTRYLIQIDGNDNVPFTVDQGDFIVTVSDDGSGNPGPSNDLICSAEALSTSMASAVNRTNKCSWEETGEPNTSNNMGGTGDDVTSNDYDETVWFTFVPTAEQSVRMQLDVTSGMLGGINYVLYEVPSTTTITCTGTPADIPTWSQLKEIASGSSTLLVGNEIDETWPCLKTSKRYYLQIDGNDLVGSVDVGNFNIQLTNSNQTTPLNDDICGIGATPGAFPSTSTSGNFGTFTTSTTKAFTAQNNTCATQQVGEPETDGPLDDITDGSYDHTLWYKFVASNTDGTYNINVTNGAGDAINAYIGVWREDNTSGAPVCTSTTWNNMTQIKESNNVDLNNNETLGLACWEIEEGKTYYVQIQGIDGVLGGDVGNNFSVSVQFTSGTTNPADNICTAPTANIGTTYNADNRCATSQANEPNVSPMPQTPSNGSSYDETLWYQFVAPASGEVRLTLSNFSVPLLLSVNMNLYEAPTGYNCATNGFTGLMLNESSGFLTSGLGSTDFRCLSPGKTYYIQFDGNDLFTDRGTWDFVINDLYAENVAPANDEPCGAEDVTQHIRSAAFGPCSSDGQYLTKIYVVKDTATDIDQATKTATAIGCNGESNCNDYWFKFTVPLSATGIRIQGNDEYSSIAGINNSDQHIGIYRAPSGCSGVLQQVNCGSGGFGNDVDMTVAAFPGETLYLQVFNADAPTNPNDVTFGFCLSVDCPAKLPCSTSSSIGYDQPQCWNMNTNGTDYNPIYYDCLSEANNSVNYFTFNTDCDGTPVDTVQMIFSLTNLGCGKTAMSMMQDNTPCTPDYQEVIVNCAVFEEVLGGTTATNFNQTYILPRCTKYVVQIISDENEASCASAGQILFVKGTSPTTILPIELLSFTGYNDGEVNVLNWTTASEINSLKFEIEKSYDATNFEYIGEKLAAGNSNIPVDYTFNDENPQVGDNYYRLKMYDTDGTFKYSEIINIKLGENNTAINDGIVKIYPNPTNGLLNIQYQASRATELDLNVFDVTGRNMINEAKKVERGMNIIQIDAMQFAKGMYILNLLDKEQQQNHQAKFVKE